MADPSSLFPHINNPSGNHNTLLSNDYHALERAGSFSAGTFKRNSLLPPVPEHRVVADDEDTYIAEIDSLMESSAQVRAQILEQSAEVSKPSIMKPLGTKYSDATLLVLTSNKNVQHRVVFQNIFPVTLSQILMDSSVAEVEYITADVTFAYTIYNIERLIGER